MATSLTTARTETHRLFATAFVTFAALAFALTAVAPVALSVAIVFLFAGPHNYVEARYFLTRLPARMGRLKPFFLFSASGVILLTATFPLLARIPQWLHWTPTATVLLVGVWNTALVVWCTTLVSMRGSQAPRRDWAYAWPCGLAVLGISWLQPMLLPLVLVYLHPLMACWVLDREIAQRKPDWLKTYRNCLFVVPVLVVGLCFFITVGTFGESSVSPVVKQQISNHSGGFFFSESVGRRLISTHAFLELIHYGIWLIAIPVASGRVFSQPFQNIPLMKRSVGLRKLIQSTLIIAGVIVGALWIGFAADYSATRDIYFTVATLHVLAEVPFLLRLL